MFREEGTGRIPDSCKSVLSHPHIEGQVHSEGICGSPSTSVQSSSCLRVGPGSLDHIGMSFGERIDEVSVVLHVEVYESVVVEIPVGPPRQRLSFLLVSLSTYHGRYIYNNHHQDNSRPDRTEKNPKGFFINSSYPSRSMEGFLREETKSAEEQRDC